ncbi:MAG: zinc ribbon domain-containing protein [Rhodanobacteraceae bacterium]|nr:zinc ribbon domain-containing protein [Rhodanobacteraceae bacterium]
MATARFCDACGAGLLAGARFCEACGAAVPQDAPARSAPPAAAPTAMPPHRPVSPASDEMPAQPAPAPGRPPAKRTAMGLLLVLAALVLAGAVGVWFALRPAQAPQRSAPPTPVQAERRPAPPAERAPAERVPTAQAPAERPPARPAVARSDIEAFKSAVLAANRAHVEAIFASADPPPELRIRLNQAIVALGQALYRHHVEGGHGDLDSARQEMRSFLEGLDQDGLGLSEPVIDEGVASVAP